MSGITPHGWLFTMTRYEALNGADSVHFLKHLLSQTNRKLLVIWDGSRIHRVVRASRGGAVSKADLISCAGAFPTTGTARCW